MERRQIDQLEDVDHEIYLTSLTVHLNLNVGMDSGKRPSSYGKKPFSLCTFPSTRVHLQLCCTSHGTKSSSLCHVSHSVCLSSTLLHVERNGEALPGLCFSYLFTTAFQFVAHRTENIPPFEFPIRNELEDE
jgi:hypothetical protein